MPGHQVPGVSDRALVGIGGGVAIGVMLWRLIFKIFGIF